MALWACGEKFILETFITMSLEYLLVQILIFGYFRFGLCGYFYSDVQENFAHTLYVLAENTQECNTDLRGFALPCASVPSFIALCGLGMLSAVIASIVSRRSIRRKEKEGSKEEEQ